MSARRTRRSAAERKNAGTTPTRLEMILFSLAALIAVAGLADSTYLTVSHLAGENVACANSAQCSEVLSSKYATVFGAPLAGLGGVGYFVAFSLATLLAFGRLWLRLWLNLTVLAMFIGTLWLLYVQAFILHAYCTYCLLSAACTFLLAGVVLAVPPRR